MSVHIYPLHDSEPHTPDSVCWCAPEKNQTGYYIHNPGNPDDTNLKWTFEITETDDN